MKNINMNMNYNYPTTIYEMTFMFFCLVFAMPFVRVCLYVSCGHLSPAHKVQKAPEII